MTMPRPALDLLLFLVSTVSAAGLAAMPAGLATVFGGEVAATSAVSFGLVLLALGWCLREGTFELNARPPDQAQDFEDRP